MNRRELIPKVGRGVEGTNNVGVDQNSSNLSKRALNAVRAFSLVAALGVVGSPSKSVEAVQNPSTVEQTGVDTKKVFELDSNEIAVYSSDGSLGVMVNPLSGYVDPLNENYGYAQNKIFDYNNGSSSSVLTQNGVNTNLKLVLNSNKSIFAVGTSLKVIKTDNFPSLSYEDIPALDVVDPLNTLLPLWNIANPDGTYNTVIAEVKAVAGTYVKQNLFLYRSSGDIIQLPLNSFSSNVDDTISVLDNLNCNYGYVGDDKISYMCVDVLSSKRVVCENLEREQVEAPAPVITLEDSYILNTNNQTLRFSVANFIAGDTVELEYLGLKITGLVANANGEVSYTFTEQDFVKIGKNECTGLLKVSVVRDGEEVASGESDVVADMVAPTPLGVSIEGDDVVATDGGFKFEIDSSQSSVTRGVVFEKPMEMGSESTVSVAKISMDELEDIDLNDPNEVRTRLLSIMENFPQVEKLNDDDFDSNGKAVRNFKFSKGDFALVTITTDPAGNSSVSLNIINVLEKATGEDMGTVETDMGGDMNNPDMTDSGKADQGGDIDMGGNPSTPVQPKTGNEDGPTCAVVNPTAPMHKTPGGLTLLFASALTLAAGFRKKGKKSE